MDLFVIEGGRPIAGRTRVSGSKNAALPIMAAAVAVDGPVRLSNVPVLADVRTLTDVLASRGVATHRGDPQRGEDGRLELRSDPGGPCVADYELVRRMRASICVLGPLLGRRREAVVSLPGGCNIGHRPIDLHLKGLRELGADIRVEGGYVHARADRLVGADIHLEGPFGSTVTGTCNVMTAACFAKGTTRISAAACEPEVVDLGRFLNACGAQVRGLGTPLVEVEGVERLHGTDYSVIPDRIEAATLLMAAAITGGEVTLTGAEPSHLAAVLAVLRQAGLDIEQEGSDLHVGRSGTLRPVTCTALPYPGVPTDVQAQLMALLTLVPGISVVTDRVFPDRFLHAPELMRLGANIRREGASAIITGVPRLTGAAVMASDLRASAALLLAALAAEGTSTLRRVYHLDRGYERLDDKLNALGMSIRRQPDDSR